MTPRQDKSGRKRTEQLRAATAEIAAAEYADPEEAWSALERRLRGLGIILSDLERAVIDDEIRTSHARHTDNGLRGLWRSLRDMLSTGQSIPRWTLPPKNAVVLEWPDSIDARMLPVTPDAASGLALTRILTDCIPREEDAEDGREARLLLCWLKDDATRELVYVGRLPVGRIGSAEARELWDFAAATGVKPGGVISCDLWIYGASSDNLVLSISAPGDSDDA